MENKILNKKVVNRKIFNLILPITLENILQMTAGLISMGMIGRLDSGIAVSALGLSTRITQMVWALLKGITTGATVFVAQSYGAGNYRKMKKVIHQTLLSSIIVASVFSIIIYYNAYALLSIFNPEPTLMASSLIYIRIAVIGIPFLAVSLIVGGVLQGMGNAKTPMKITFIMNVVNIVVGYVLIFGKLGFNSIGIKGAAIATVISQITAAAIGLYILYARKGVLHSYINRKMFSLDIRQIYEVYKVGLPASIETMAWQVAAIFLTIMLLTFGEVAFAAHQLGLQAESISYMPAIGFGIAATTFIGQCLGAGDKTNAKLYLKQTIKGSILMTSISVIILLVFPSQVMMLLTDKKDIIRLGTIYLRLMGLVQLPQNVAGVLNGALRGAGYTNIPMITAMSGLWGIRVLFSAIIVYCFKGNIINVWVIMCVDLVFRFFLSLILYKKKNIYKDKTLVYNSEILE